MTLSTALNDPTSTTNSSQHHHVWELESSHSTSQGQVNYMKCAAGCGTRQIELVALHPQQSLLVHTTTSKR